MSLFKKRRNECENASRQFFDNDPPAPPDLQSGGSEYKDLQSGNGIANADIQHDGISNPVEQSNYYELWKAN